MFGLRWWLIPPQLVMVVRTPQGCKRSQAVSSRNAGSKAEDVSNYSDSLVRAKFRMKWRRRIRHQQQKTDRRRRFPCKPTYASPRKLSTAATVRGAAAAAAAYTEHNTARHGMTQRQRQFVSPHSTLAILSLATNKTKAHSLSTCRVKEVICQEYTRVLVEAQVNASAA